MTSEEELRYALNYCNSVREALIFQKGLMGAGRAKSPCWLVSGAITLTADETGVSFRVINRRYD